MTAGTQSPSELLPQGAPDGAKEIVDAKSAEDVKAATSAQNEHDATYWLLQPQTAPRYSIEVKFETPQGTKPLVFTLEALPGPAIDEIERRFYNEDPLKIDDMGMACALVAAATKGITDKDTGSEIDLASKAFLGPSVMLADALQGRFIYQSGVMVSLANEVRRISGWGPDRVGKASRVLVNLAGN